VRVCAAPPPSFITYPSLGNIISLIV